jgi:site-specific recombinase XerD
MEGVIMSNFQSIFKDDINNFLAIRKTTLSDWTIKHDISYLASFDKFLANIGIQEKVITEAVFIEWQKTLTGKSGSKAGKIITIRTFIKYLHSLGIPAHTPVIPKIVEDYIPYIFSDQELERIFCAADNNLFTKGQPNPHIKIEFPMILRLLYGCGLRIGETLALQRYERGPCQHCLRHVFVFKSFAQAQKNGRNIDDCVPFLSIYLGHDSLRETEKYLKFSSELFPNALELFENYTGMVFPEVDYEM